MDELIHGLVEKLGIGYLFVITAVMLYLLAKGADLLVDEAVTLSTRWGIPKVLIGATVVSLGTTAPEASVSVLAAIKGSPGLALGSAVGSTICDTGLILGTAALIAPLPLNRKIVNRQGWLQLGAGFLLVIACLPFGSLHTTFSEELLFRTLRISAPMMFPTASSPWPLLAAATTVTNSGSEVPNATSVAAIILSGT